MYIHFSLTHGNNLCHRHAEIFFDDIQVASGLEAAKQHSCPFCRLANKATIHRPRSYGWEAVIVLLDDFIQGRPWRSVIVRILDVFLPGLRPLQHLTSRHGWAYLFFTSAHLHIFSSSHMFIFTSSHLHIFSSSHLLIFTSSHLHVLISSHLHILSLFLSWRRWADVRRCEDVKMWGCEDEKMWKWESVKMRRCEDEKMWRWEDVKMRKRFTDPHCWKNPALRRSREKCER